MSELPILFEFSELLAGKGFVAQVHVRGRALLEESEGDAVFYAVEPSGFAGCGEDRGSAYLDFRQNYRRVLFDFAAEAADFAGFRATVDQFFVNPNGQLEAAWDQAVAGVRDGSRRAEWGTLVRDYSQRRIEVQLIEHAEPSVNATDASLELAA